MFVESLQLLRTSGYPVADSVRDVLKAQVALYEKLGRAEDAARGRAELSTPTSAPASQPAR
jgi:hypothetical protein